MLSLIIAESSLELIPKELQHHNSVVAHARKMGKRPSEILLDNSWHFGAMRGINNEIKRGRPDLVHFCLLEACTVPLYFEDEVSVYVHTLDDKVIIIEPGVHLPKSYHRFAGLMEKLFAEKIIKADGQKLLEIKNMTFSELVDKIKPDNVIGLSSEGIKSSYYDAAATCTSESCLVIGAFPKGHFSDPIKKKINTLLSIDTNSIEAHVAVARVLYEYEKTVFM